MIIMIHRNNPISKTERSVRMKKTYVIPGAICLLMLAVNIISRFSTGFSDFYINRIFPYISAPFLYLSGLLPFSLGEIFIIAGIILVVVGIPAFIFLLILKKNSRKKIFKVFSVSLIWIFTYVFTAETLNCFVMYQGTTISESRFRGSSGHTEAELTELYGILIDETNALSEQVKRDENGYFVMTDDLFGTAKKTMRRASATDPRLSGFYPDAKPIMSSYFMSQSGVLGIYFPFTLEANYNKDISQVNLPDTICHEYAHLKGIIREDEAGFTAFAACTESESPDFRYSGYLDALEYVHNEIYENKISGAYGLTDTISEDVKKDWFHFLPEKYWDDNKDKEIIPTETVDKVSSAATDASLRLNGVDDGVESYGGIVDLLLDYYF